MERKWLRILCIMLAVLTLAGCGRNKDKESSSAPTEGEGQEQPAETQGIDFDKIVLRQLTEPKEGEDIAVLHTNMGDITLRFFPEEAPLAVENFLSHAREQYYDGMLFHRVIYEMMIQTGDPLTKDAAANEKYFGTGGDSIWGGGFENEISPNLYHFRGALAMANTGAANTNGSQFFIVQATYVESELIDQMQDPEVWWFNNDIVRKYIELGGAPWLDRRYTVFGHVIDGMDVVDQIAATPVKDAENADINKRDYLPITPVVVEWVEVKAFEG